MKRGIRRIPDALRAGATRIDSRAARLSAGVLLIQFFSLVSLVKMKVVFAMFPAYRYARISTF